MLPSIRFAMNTAKCDSTGYSAAYITFGRELRTPTEANFDFKAIVMSENCIPQITPHLLRLGNILGKVNESQGLMQDKNKKLKDSNRRSQPYLNIGDKVLLTTHMLSKAKKGLTAKLTPRKTQAYRLRWGPYVVMNKKGSLCYVIASIDNPNIPIATHHISDITPYNNNDGTEKPIYPIQQRGRSKNINILDTKQQQNNNIVQTVKTKNKQHNRKWSTENAKIITNNNFANNSSANPNDSADTPPRRSSRLRRIPNKSNE